MITPLEIGVTTLIGRVVRLREGHEAIIYILVAKDTIDESWLNKSIGYFESPIEYLKIENI